ncbi:MAG: phage recombination protein Bet [Planctomycetaceae bacterium]|nr:phage recombination protein Bet [Planctomycetaceae bacterium]
MTTTTKPTDAPPETVEAEVVDPTEQIALAPVQKVRTADLVVYTPEQVSLLKRTIAQNTTDDEFALFLHVCKRSGLDPFARQIYAIKRRTKRGDVMTIQTGIDGYRTIAQRTNHYAGQDDAVFDIDNKGLPVSATVTVYRMVDGMRCPFTATARWKEYSSNTNPMWSQMPFNQLAKCAEALALRKGFPAELSGLYTAEEMDQADRPEPREVPAADPAQPKAAPRHQRVSPPPQAAATPSGAAAVSVFKTPEYAAMVKAFQAKFPGSSQKQFLNYCIDVAAGLDLTRPDQWTMGIVKDITEALSHGQR